MKKWKKWYIRSVDNGKGVKCFIIIREPSYTPWTDRFKMNLGGDDIKILNRLLSGHDMSPHGKRRWKNKNNLSEQCDTCNKTNDATHIVFECKKYTGRDFGQERNIIEWIKCAKSENIRKLMKFLKINKIDL